MTPDRRNYMVTPVTESKQSAEDIRAAAESNYLETIRQIEIKRLEIARMSRQVKQLTADVLSLETTARELRRAALGEGE